MAEEKKSNNFQALLKQFALTYKQDGNTKETCAKDPKGKEGINQKIRKDGIRSSSRPKQPTKRYASPGDSLQRPSVTARPRLPSNRSYSPAGKKRPKAKQGPARSQRTPDRPAALRTPDRPATKQRMRRGRVSSTPQSSVGSPSEDDENQIALSPISEAIPTIQNNIRSSYANAKRPVPACSRAGGRTANQSKVGGYMNDVSYISASHQFLQPRAPPPRLAKTRRAPGGFPTSIDPVEELANREYRSYQAALEEILAEHTINVFDKIVYMKELEERLLSEAAEMRAPPPSVAGSIFGYEPPRSHHPNTNWYTNAWMQQSTISNAWPGTGSIHQRPAQHHMSNLVRDMSYNSRHVSHLYRH